MPVKTEQRIFIKNLPETVTDDEIKTLFSKYGDVIVADIKERKNVNIACSSSKFFAYVNVKIDSRSLQKCFNYFANNQWKGQNIELQIAKQSVLERLKQEREGSKVCKNDESIKQSSSSILNDVHMAEDNMEESAKIVDNITDVAYNEQVTVNAETSHVLITELNDKTSDSGEHAEEQKNEIPQSELKRLQSVNQMVKGYQLQKAAIRAALSNLDRKPNNKIILNEDKLESITSGKKMLFDEDDDHSVKEFNFDVKATFEGKKGRELLELQSKYKNDKRFILNERFMEECDDSIEQDGKNLEQTHLEEEKRKQFEILEQVLGNQFKSKTSNSEKASYKGLMLRFDPTRVEHLQYEMKNAEDSERNKRKHKSSQRANENIENPEVSKQVFYNVSGDLKSTLQNSENKFSLLNLFESDKLENHEEIAEEKIIKSVNVNSETNPFRYDSSDDEVEEAHMKEERTLDEGDRGVSKFWTEPFFFRDDDYRLQEGLDFLKKMSEKKDEFMVLRRNLKEVVKAKVRNNHRKNKMFKKKLGGSKKKKMIKIKRAMKR